MNYALPSQPPRRTQPDRTGGAKRRQKNALPKCVWVYEKQDKTVTGAMVLHSCEASPTSMELRWTADRAVKFVEPVPITAGMIKYLSLVFELSPTADLDLRHKEAACGDGIVLQFPEFMEHHWKVWTSTRNMDGPYADPATAFTFTTSSSYARAAGVSPVTVETFTPLPQAPENVIANEDELDDAHPQVHAAPADAAPAGSELPTAATRIQALYSEQLRGTVTHRYKPSAILRCLALQRHIKPSSTLADVIIASGNIILGHEDAQELSTMLREKRCHLPGNDVLRSARIRLDLLSVLWEQGAAMDPDEIFFRLCDSSPQMGIDFLCVIEDKFKLPTVASIASWTEPQIDLNDAFTSQVELMSSIGSGRAGLAKKTSNVANGLLMKSRSDEHFHDRRRKHRGNTSDQGTERGMNDTPVDVLPRFDKIALPGTPESYLYPYSFYQPGMLHVLYDALEEASKKTRSTNISWTSLELTLVS